ncbi:hypothetical protein [Pseudomonas sp. dw_612]|uniref:hypothetical protein n=1 Tax=Pseudomonas sp. dw_612 TaxID=2720080 RepID=UPI002115D593|nr:hypothetical protein [Pseudomonas sp. dw_612]
MAALVAAAAFLAWTTPVFSNALMLLMDRENFIPPESSIWMFEPYDINQGSSSYWVYGEDLLNFYYFARTPEMPYRLIARDNTCAGFDKRDVSTWCTP